MTHNMTYYGVYRFNRFSYDGKKKILQAVKRKSVEGITNEFRHLDINF